MITTLSNEQKALLPEYARIGIEIGLATGGDMDEAEVEELMQKHREMCGIKRATKFAVYDSPFSAIKNVKGLTAGNALYGQHDINWLIYYQYMRVELGVKGLEIMQYLLELAKRVGWMWMGEYTNIATRRPEELHMIKKPIEDGNTIKVCHNYNDYAIKYRDGTEVCIINGVRIPSEYTKYVFIPANELSISDIMAIKNTEIRTEFLKKIGIERAFDSLSKKMLDEYEAGVGGKYELFSIELGNVTRHYLRGSCPSNNEPFFEAVPPYCNTVESAIMWRNFGDHTLKFTLPTRLT